MAVVHQATANVVQTIGALHEHGGWMSTSDIANQADIHRDTCRKVLAELKLYDWVVHAERDGQDRWRLGMALPELGLEHQARINTRIRELHADSTRLARAAGAMPGEQV